jgi:hypothetical protein
LPEFSPIILALASGLAGSLITLVLSSLRERNRLALDFVNEYSKMFFDLSFVYHLLKKPNEYNYEKSNNSILNIKKMENFNLILRIGNWFNIVAALYIARRINRKIIHAADIDKEILKFNSYISKAPMFEKWKENWKYIDELKTKSNLGMFRSEI